MFSKTDEVITYSPPPVTVLARMCIGSLEPGDIFGHEGVLYLVIDSVDGDSADAYDAWCTVRTTTGEVVTLNQGAIVDVYDWSKNRRIK